jgi:hypothetical protein
VAVGRGCSPARMSVPSSYTEPAVAAAGVLSLVAAIARFVLATNMAANMLMPEPAIGSTLLQAFASRLGNSSGPATAGSCIWA